MKTSRAFSLVLLVIGVFVAACFFWSHQRAEQREREAYAEEGRKVQAVVADMGSRWNAIAHWQDGFKGRIPSTIYTTEVEKAVLSERPILFYAHLDDIKTAGDGYTAQLSSPVTQWFLHMQYRLHCDAALAQKFAGEKRSEFEIFAIVAYIDRVEKRTESDNSYFLR